MNESVDFIINLAITLYWNIEMSTMWQICDISLQYHLNVKMFAILILQILILQGGGDNTVHRKMWKS